MCKLGNSQRGHCSNEYLEAPPVISKYFFLYLISYCYMEIVYNFVGVNSYIISLDVIEIQVQLVICCLVCETYLLSNQGSYQFNKRQASAHNILPEPPRLSMANPSGRNLPP